MSHLEMHQFICRSDNYGLLVHDHKTGATASIDAPDALAIEKQLAKRGWQLTHIFTTHHHGDHVEGNQQLKDQFGCIIVGPMAEADRIPAIRKQVSGGETFTWAGREVKVGRGNGVETEILEGVGEGARLVVYPGDKVTDGARVNPLVVGRR